MDRLQELGYKIRNEVWEAALLVVLPLVFCRGFTEPFSTPKSFLTKFAVIGGLALLGLEEVSRARVRRPSFNLAMPLAMFSVVLLGSCLMSPVPRFSLMETVYGLCGPGWLLLLVFWEKGEKSIQRISVLVAIAGGLVAGFTLLQRIGFDPILLGGYHVDWGTMVPRMHLYSTFGNPNFVGGYLIGAIFAAVALIAISRIWQAKVIWSGVTFMMAVAIILTGSHGAWLGLTVGSSAALVMVRSSNASNGEGIFRNLGMASVKSIGVPVLCAPITLITFQWAQRLAAQLHGRVYLWQFSWPAFWRHPIMGSGWGTYQLLYLDLQGQFLAVHPEYAGYWTNNRLLHNDPLQLLLETGLLGFGTFVWVLWRYGRDTVRARRASPESWPRYAIAMSVGGVTAILTDSVFNYQFAVPPTYVLLFTLLAIPYLIGNDKQERENNRDAIATSIARLHCRSFIRKVAGCAAIIAAAAALFIQQTRLLTSERLQQLAFQLEQHNDLATAESVFRRSVELNDLNGRARFGLSRVLFSRVGASEALAQVIQSEQTFADSHQEVLRGQILERMGKTREAIEAYHNASWLDPTLIAVDEVPDHVQRTSRATN